MLNQRATELGSAPNKIRELFAYGLKRKAEIGEENVFDFSIGNPSVPAPDAVAESIAELIKEPPCALHGYTPSPGAAGPRQAVADISAAVSASRLRPTRSILPLAPPLASPSASTR